MMIIVLIICLSLSTAGFDYLLTSPFHELGHALVGLILGVQITRIEWGRTHYISSHDWRENIMGYAGGLFATLFLMLLYVIMKRAKPLLVKREMRVRLKQGLLGATIMLQIIILADVMMQLTASVLEGSIKDFYDVLIRNVPVLFIILMIFTGISIFIHLVKMDQPTIELLSVKRQTRSSIENQPPKQDSERDKDGLN